MTYYSSPVFPNDPTTGTAQGTTQTDVVTFGTAVNAAPHPTVGLTWSARYVGFVKAYQDGVNTFGVVLSSTGVGVGEQVKVWVDNSPIIDLWGANGVSLTQTGTINLKTSVPFYDLKIDYASRPAAGAVNALTFQWYPGGSATTITSASLFYGFHIKNSPMTVDVFPAGTCAATSNMYGPALTTLTAGVPASFTIYSRDAYNNVRGEGRTSFFVQLSGADSLSALVTDRGDGSYNVSFTPTKSGSYDIASTLSGAHINLSPKTGIIARPARRHLSSSPISGMGVTLATAGIQSTLTLTVRDVHGNLQPEASWTVGAGTGPDLAITTAEGVFVTTPAPNPNCPTDCPNGAGVSTVILRNTITRSGMFNLHLKATNLLDGAVQGSPFSITVLPHLQCATASTAFGSDPPRFITFLTAGVPATFTVTVRDMFSNLRTMSVATDLVCLSRQVGLRDRNGTVSATGPNSGSFSCTAVATLAGTQQVWARLVSYGALSATYYSFATDTPVFTEITSKALDFSTTAGMTALGVDIGLRARFTGVLRPTSAETYVFTATVKTNTERISLYVDNSLIIDQWSSIGPTLVNTGTIVIDSVEANTLIDIVVNYKNWNNVAAGTPGLTLKWSCPINHASSVISTSSMAADFHVSGSPFSVVVVPGQPCATTSRLSSQGLSVCTVGMPATFTFSSRDSFNNVVTSSTGTSSVSSFSFSLLRNSVLATYFANPSLLEAFSNNDGGSVISSGAFATVNGVPGSYLVTYVAPTLAGRLELQGSKLEVGGLAANYFENADLTDNGQQQTGSSINGLPTYSRVDASIDFTWGTGQPVLSPLLAAQSKLISADYFSARWTGWVVPAFSEIYTFSVEGDDGARLWIDGLKIVDAWVRECFSQSLCSLAGPVSEKIDFFVMAMELLCWSCFLPPPLTPFFG